MAGQNTFFKLVCLQKNINKALNNDDHNQPGLSSTTAIHANDTGSTEKFVELSASEPFPDAVVEQLPIGTIQLSKFEESRLQLSLKKLDRAGVDELLWKGVVTMGEAKHRTTHPVSGKVVRLGV